MPVGRGLDQEDGQGRKAEAEGVAPEAAALQVPPEQVGEGRPRGVDQFTFLLAKAVQHIVVDEDGQDDRDDDDEAGQERVLAA